MWIRDNIQQAAAAVTSSWRTPTRSTVPSVATWRANNTTARDCGVFYSVLIWWRGNLKKAPFALQRTFALFFCSPNKCELLSMSDSYTKKDLKKTKCLENKYIWKSDSVYVRINVFCYKAKRGWRLCLFDFTSDGNIMARITDASVAVSLDAVKSHISSTISTVNQGCCWPHGRGTRFLGQMTAKGAAVTKWWKINNSQ